MPNPRLLRWLLALGLLLGSPLAQPVSAVNQRPGEIENPKEWQLQVIATRGTTGLGNDLALTPDGLPRLSYFQLIEYQLGSRYQLVYAAWDGLRWNEQLVADRIELDPLPGAPERTALALDPGGNPHIAYVDGDDLYYVHWTGTAWDRQHLAGGPERVSQPSLALNAKGWPALSYAQGGDLYYAFWDGGQWHMEAVPGDLGGRGNALALDLAGRPHISLEQQGLTYTTRTPGGWVTQSVDPGVDLQGTTAIALAADQTPRVAYLTDSGEIRYAAWTGSSWVTETAVSLTPPLTERSPQVDVDLALDAADAPHLLYSGSYSGSVPLTYVTKPADFWQSRTLDPGDGRMGSANALALDAEGDVHASYYEATYHDLRYITYAPDWVTRTVVAGAAIPTTDVEVRQAGPVIGVANDTADLMALIGWNGAWQVNAFDLITQTVPQLSMALAQNGEFFSYYDTDNKRLMYVNRLIGIWSYQIVDEGEGAGLYNDLVLVGHYSGYARIAYWDKGERRIKLALLRNGVPPVVVYPNDEAPPLSADSGRLSAALLPAEKVAVSYYDEGNGDLRLGVWDPKSESWTDELVAGASSDAGLWSALKTDATTGELVLAYYDLSDDAIYYAYQQGGAWIIEPTPAMANVGYLEGLALELGLNSFNRPRIAYLGDEGTTLAVVSRTDGGDWVREVVNTGGLPQTGLSMALDERVHLAYGDNGLQYALRLANLDLGPKAERAIPSEAAYNPMDACLALVHFLAGGAYVPHAGAGLPAYMHPRAPAAAATGPLDDEGIFMHLEEVFEATPAGEDYVALYAAHGAEMGQLGLDDPDLMWDAYGALQNFLPGLEALVTGRGDEHVVTQAMVDDALDIWQRTAAAASPALAGEINTRLAQYHNLQDFVGLTFAQWAAAIGVAAPDSEAPVYLPLIQR